jgi:hypothetical protein
MPSLTPENSSHKPVSLIEESRIFKQLLTVLNDIISKHPHIPSQNWYEFTLDCVLFLRDTNPPLESVQDVHRTEATLVNLTTKISKSGAELALIDELCNSLSYLQTLEFVNTSRALDSLAIDLVHTLKLINSRDNVSNVQ